MASYVINLTDTLAIEDAPTVSGKTFVRTAGAMLQGNGYVNVRESPPDWINKIPAKASAPVIDFTFGIRAVDATDTTITASTVTFATTSVAGVTPNMVVETIEPPYGVHQYGTVLTVDGATNSVTIDRWIAAANFAYGVVTPPAATPAANGTRTLISQFGPVFAYTVGATIYPQDGPLAFKYGPGQQISFAALANFPPSSNVVPAEYYWDFGDGTKATGQNVTHAYRLPNNTIRAVLKVVDTQGVTWTVGKQLYVMNLAGLVVHPGIIVSLAA